MIAGRNFVWDNLWMHWAFLKSAVGASVSREELARQVEVSPAEATDLVEDLPAVQSLLTQEIDLCQVNKRKKL